LIRPIRGLTSLSIYFKCDPKEHDFSRLEGTTAPILLRCTKCGVYGFMRRKGIAHRNGRVVAYRCSTRDCTRPAKIHSRYRSTAGMYEWACSPDHASGTRFQAAPVAPA
jgi:hypothetical protein